MSRATMNRRFITYFDKEGEDNTDDLILAIEDKLRMVDHIDTILIASNTGESALKLNDAVSSDIKIINITHHAGFSKTNELEISEDMIKKLEKVGIETHCLGHAFSGASRGITNKYGGFSPLDIVADTLRMFSHGVKVACEISLMAADAGIIPVGKEIIVVAGRKHGIDTAVILTPVNSKDLFDLKINEIFAMPRQ